jgi:hypothetical protein
MRDTRSQFADSLILNGFQSPESTASRMKCEILSRHSTKIKASQKIRMEFSYKGFIPFVFFFTEYHYMFSYIHTFPKKKKKKPEIEGLN